MKGLRTSQSGAVTIIEAVFVFPITLFIVFFMIMMGEAYYQRACVERYVVQAAISGAAECENPMLEEVISSGSVPTDPRKTSVKPYRYIFSSEAKSIAEDVESSLAKSIRSLKPLLFKNMSPENVSVDVEAKMYILFSSLKVECSFSVPFPIKMFFTDESIAMEYELQMTAPIGDPTEFVRDVSTVQDFVERSDTIMDIVGDISSALGKIGTAIN